MTHKTETNKADLLGRFVWHELMTTDLKEALAFYGGVFPEWSVEKREINGGMDYHVIWCGEDWVGGFVPLSPTNKRRSHWIGYVAVDNCDAVVAKFERQGGRSVARTMSLPGVGRFAIVADPEQATIKPFQVEESISLPEGPRNGQFCWDELLTREVETACRLYGDAFRWTVDRDTRAGGGGYTIFKAGASEVAGVTLLPPNVEQPCWVSYIAAEDIDERAAAIERHGGQTLRQPWDIPGVGRASVHADPTGAIIALFHGACNES